MNTDIPKAFLLGLEPVLLLVYTWANLSSLSPDAHCIFWDGCHTKGREQGGLINSPPCLAACSEVFWGQVVFHLMSLLAVPVVQFVAGKPSPEHPGGWICCCPAAEARQCPPKKTRVQDALWISLSSDFHETLRRELGVYAWTRRSVMKRKTTVFTHFRLSSAFQINPEISCTRDKVCTYSYALFSTLM